MVVSDEYIEQARTRASFAEGFFLLMRERRYGIESCKHCEDIDLLAARYEIVHAMENGLNQEE